MRFVPIKSDEQLDLQAMHRVRTRLVQRRTALINEIRGFLLERGIIFSRRADSPAQGTSGCAGRRHPEPDPAAALPTAAAAAGDQKVLPGSAEEEEGRENSQTARRRTCC
jgi:transposase